MLRPVILLCLLALPAAGAASQLQALLPGAKERGAATFRLLGLPVYQARLFTSDAAPLDWSQDFGIELTYQRSISQADLTGATLREMRRMGNPPPPEAKLAACFQNVAPGDRYLAVSRGPDRVDFLRNGRTTCSLRHPQIKRHFMSIFLGAKSRSASFTRSLLG
ncbi:MULTISPECIES: hypothetical protein [unclassified Leisingera]|uniref:hypothetical protein n=1 Tax=unclassified Leisingera TaxID=2614906 RepID=UPI0008683508|nr:MULTISPECIES: hypothetical protein [unclassified Leisingera]MCF6433577.1 hypothetical protein [Leisingera sp. MMG026]OED50525.1 hypothetical protein AB838_01910 [Rhodobacteraceae bacterium (ex Bugula neritina AB1)]QAX28184.1 hypothetical protein ETW24_01520 [Leisingera sp. NJS204]